MEPQSSSLETRKGLGQYGERLASKVLCQKGFDVIASNWRFGRNGELDLVCRRLTDSLLVFVEVKTRSSRRFGSSLEAIDQRKAEKLLLLGAAFLNAHPEYANDPVRFDLVAIDVERHSRKYCLQHVEDVLSTFI